LHERNLEAPPLLNFEEFLFGGENGPISRFPLESASP
jgi:hypothetical protein